MSGNSLASGWEQAGAGVASGADPAGECIHQLAAALAELAALKGENPGASADEPGGGWLPFLVALICVGLSSWGVHQWLKEARVHLSQIQRSQGQVSMRMYISYRVDCWFSQDADFKPKLLLGMTVVLVATGSLLYFVAAETSYPEAVWAAWTFVAGLAAHWAGGEGRGADPGTHADEKAWGARLVSFAVSLGGMMVFALMIGLVTDTISMYVDSLKKGRSKVLETGHTLILGWSSKILPLIAELAEANASEGGGVIVVCADKDAETMDSLLEEANQVDLKGSTVMCRHRSFWLIESADLLQCRQISLCSETDLRTVSVTSAKSIIILAESDIESDASDAQVLRTMLTVMAFEDKLSGHIVVELCDIDNKTHVQLIGGEHVEVVCSHDILGRMMVLGAVTRGLSGVYDQLLGFEGQEFYDEEWPQLHGKEFGEAVFWFESAVLCGIIKEDGGTFINPEDSTVIQPGDRMLVLAEDDSTYTVSNKSHSPGTAYEAYIRGGWVHDRVSEEAVTNDYLFCGWRRDIGDMILLLDEFVHQGSTLTIMCETEIAEREASFRWQGRDMSKLLNLEVKHVVGNPTIRHHLEQLNLSKFCSIMILGDEHESNARDSDAHTIATMLLIRDIQSNQHFGDLAGSEKGMRSPSQRGDKMVMHQSQMWFDRAQSLGLHAKIACEILESHTKRLQTLQSVSDYIMSHEMLSKYIAMVAENRKVHKVLEELFSSVGNEVYLRSADLYVRPEEQVTPLRSLTYLTTRQQMSFWDLTVRARARGEILLGYRVLEADPDGGRPVQTIVLNPAAESRNELMGWHDDKAVEFIVLAQDDEVL